ncbi:MAG: murein transglycosylase [Hoeflea sp.]|uniref:lytic transglycosylase domain-containing protein n=1 Tax=Hoeflea sp. TaxID=1940281 RepID=UPI000C0F05B2|nr:transglycosylase SLT domain-containing protein [Hoeflea sp.]PHR19012.1 MAG: murein transglycosylase [Hoeflea sp.]
MRFILTAAAAALLSLALSGCETTGVSSETTGSISSSKIKSSSMSFGYSSRPHGKLISKYAKSHGVPESLAHAVITVESNYRANARGAAGEVGLMQIKPATARMMGYKGSTKALYDPETNIKYGMKYLAKAHQLGGGTTCGTILKYNAGHGAKRMNPISKRYCGKVAKLMK